MECELLIFRMLRSTFTCRLSPGPQLREVTKAPFKPEKYLSCFLCPRFAPSSLALNRLFARFKRITNTGVVDSERHQRGCEPDEPQTGKLNQLPPGWNLCQLPLVELGSMYSLLS